MPRKKHGGEGGAVSSLVPAIPNSAGPLPMVGSNPSSSAHQSQSRGAVSHTISNTPSPLFSPPQKPSANTVRPLRDESDHRKLIERREALLRELDTIREQNGLRPRAPSAAPAAEIRKRSRSTWTVVLDEMVWMATDVAEEKSFKDAQRLQIAAGLLANRAKRKKSKCAANVERFWEMVGGQVDGRPQPVGPHFQPLPRAVPPDTTPLFPSLTGIDVQSMSIRQRLTLVRRLMQSSAAKVDSASSFSPYFSGVLSPVQFHSLKRLAQLTRFGLGAIASDSDKADHRTTIASLIAFLASELEVPGPHLICCTDELDVAYFQAVIAIRCQDFRIVPLPEHITEEMIMFGPRDVVVCNFSASFATLSELEADWGLIVYSLGPSAFGDIPVSQSSTPGTITPPPAISPTVSDDVILANGTSPAPSCPPFTLPKIPQRPRWARPIFVLNADLSTIFSKNNISGALVKALDLEVHQLSEVVASASPSLFAAHTREDADFPVMELLIACPETQDQRLKRRAAKGDQALLEAAAIHSNLTLAASFASSWSADPVPPPRRHYSSATWSIDAITLKHSGKFVEAMNLILSHRCRRAIVLSSKKIVLDAFFALASLNLICFRMDIGSIQSRISSWIRFLDSDFACILARPADMERCTSRKMNGAIDSVILLDCYSPEQDVARIRAVVKHATVYRMFTRGTAEQNALESAQHPCLHPASASTGAASSSTSGINISNSVCELRVIQRSFETEPMADNTVSVTNEEQERALIEAAVSGDDCKGIRDYAGDFATGRSGSSSFHPFVLPLGSPANHGSEGVNRSLAEALPLYYDAKSAKSNTHQQQLAPPPQRGKGTLPPLPQNAPQPRAVMALGMYNFQVVSDQSEAERASLLDRQRYMVSFGARHEQSGSLTPPLQGRKKQSRSTASEDGVFAPSLAPATLSQGIYSASGFVTPFSPLEDDVIRQVMEKYGFHPLLAADMINGSRALRSGADGHPALTRTAKEVAERYLVLQKAGAMLAQGTTVSTILPGGSEHIDQTTVQQKAIPDDDMQKSLWFVPPSEICEEDAQKSASMRLDFWNKTRKDSSSAGVVTADADILQTVVAGTARRITPIQWLSAPPSASQAQQAPGSSNVQATTNAITTTVDNKDAPKQQQ